MADDGQGPAEAGSSLPPRTTFVILAPGAGPQRAVRTMTDDAWRGRLLQLGNGQVLVRGSATITVLRALEAAQRVTRADGGYGAHRDWLVLLEVFRAAAAEAVATSRAGSAEVPIPAAAPTSVTDVDDLDVIDTRGAAELLGCTDRNVRDLRSRGVLASGRMLGGRWHFDRHEVTEHALHRRETATEGEP